MRERLTNAANPGGKKILQRVAGKDASKQFWKYHNEGILKKYQAKLQVGSLDTKPKPEPKEEAPAPKPAPKPAPTTVVSAKSATEDIEPLEPFGALIPFADPSWYQGVSCTMRNRTYTRFFKLADSGLSTVCLALLQRDARRPTSRGSRVDREGYRAVRHRVG